MKRDPNQLELFECQPKPAVIHLPFAVWGRTVWRELADAFVHQMIARPERMDFWWRGLDHQAAQDLKRQGATDTEITVELRKARQYVTLELLKADPLRRHA